MVEQVRISPEEVRGYGNVLEEHELDDFTVNVSSLSKVSEEVHGALTTTYKLLYSVYGLMFDFDKGAKQLYLQTNEANTLSLGFDTVNKQLYLVDENDTGFSLDFDEDTNELYISDDAPPIVHNYSLALDSDSYTTTSGSLSVSATLLDNGVAVEGATISFTGGDATVTGVTNGSGVATATVTFSASGTLTATYSNVSDTASVTVSQSLLLSTNKSILSYVDSESATLTATHSGGSGKTVEIYNSVTGTKIGDATDNNDGTYTYTYSATGNGNISLTAKSGTIESNAIQLEDCILYDESSSSNLSKWTVPTGLSFTFDTDHYVCKLTSQDWKNLNRTFTSSVTAFTLEYDVLFTNNQSNTQLDTYVLGTDNKGMSVLNSPIDSVYRLSSATAVGTQRNSVSKTRSYTRNVWYHIETIVEQGTTTTNMYQNNTLVETITNTNITFTNLNKLAFYIGWASQATIHLKNIKIK